MNNKLKITLVRSPIGFHWRQKRTVAGLGLRRLTATPDFNEFGPAWSADGSRIFTLSDGMGRNLVQGPDPRFGMQAPIISSATTRTPSGLTHSLSTTRAATLSDATTDDARVRVTITNFPYNFLIFPTTVNKRTITDTEPYEIDR